jgi:amphiphysin
MTQAKDSLQNDLQQLERLVVAPTTDLIAILDHIKRYLTKRAHKLLDYDRFAESLKTITEKVNRNSADEKKMGQLQVSFDQASREYNSINSQLIQDLKTFLAMRKDFIDPCLLTFYFYQVRVYDTLYRIYYQVGNAQFDLNSTALAGYQHVQEEVMAMLASLSVCKAIGKPANTADLQDSAGSSSALSGRLAPSYTNSLSQKPFGGLAAPTGTNIRASYDGPSRLLEKPEETRVSLDTKLKRYVVALYDFEAQAEGDLAFRKDDRIEVLEMKEVILIF